MPKRVKIILAVSLAALLLAVGAGITVMAADTPTPTPPVALAQHEGIADRTAKILGISVDTLVAAEKQAREELWQKPSSGTTPTPVSSDDYYARVAQILGNGMTGDKLVAAMQQASKEISDEAMTNELNQAFQNGKITQDEANQIKDWLSKRPSALDKLFGFRGFGGMMGGFGGRMGPGGFGGCPGFGGGREGGFKPGTPKASPAVPAPSNSAS